jgi:uroporphyrinogen-III synthase
MSAWVLILRPQPGADESAARARAIGLEPAVAPLFAMRAIAWAPPTPGGFGAVMLTSANAARHAGDALTSYAGLPCYTVGEATAAAAAAAGFADVRIGPDDGAALLDLLAADGVTSLFHPCGQDHLPLEREGVNIVRVPVYAADAVDRLPDAAGDALGRGAVALLHSPRAAAHFSRLIGDGRADIAVAAISVRTARATGPGWRILAVSPRPRDQALLELAAKLCQTGGGE